MIELRGRRSALYLSPTVWTMTLELAHLLGWLPAGTKSAAPSKSAEGDFDVNQLMAWTAQYTTSDGQTVTADDAAHLANALDRACHSIEPMMSDWSAGKIRTIKPLRTPPGAFAWFTTTPGRQHLLAVAAFCRAGEFQIR